MLACDGIFDVLSDQEVRVCANQCQLRAASNLGPVGSDCCSIRAASIWFSVFGQVIEIGCMNFGDAEEAAKAIVREARHAARI